MRAATRARRPSRVSGATSGPRSRMSTLTVWPAISPCSSSRISASSRVRRSTGLIDPRSYGRGGPARRASCAAAAHARAGRVARRPRAHRRRRARAAVRAPRRPARGVHEPPRRPAPPRGRDLVPGRPPGPRARTCAETALREAEEEIGLRPAAVEVVGRAAADADLRDGYAIYPFVGVIEPGAAWRPSPSEVAAVLELSLDDAAGRLRDAAPGAPRRALPHRRPTRSAAHLIWGATARILRRPASSGFGARLLRLDVLLDRDVDQVAPLGPRAVVVLDVVAGRAARAARTRCGPSARRSGSRR